MCPVLFGIGPFAVNNLGRRAVANGGSLCLHREQLGGSLLKEY